MKNGYNPKIVTSYFLSCGLPEPEFEFRFYEKRKWRWDLAWPYFSSYEQCRIGVAIEVQGGIWTSGRHNRGAAMLKEFEKLNEAAAMGWRVLFVQPKDLCTMETVNLVRRCLGISVDPESKGVDANEIKKQVQTIHEPEPRRVKRGK